MKSLFLVMVLFLCVSLSAQTGTGGGGTGTGGGGGGATLPFPGLVFATSATGGRVATSDDVISGFDNPSTTLYVNDASTYSGTPDGSPYRPFLTVADAFNSMTQSTMYTVVFLGGGTYAEPAFTWPSAPTAVTIVGNQSVYNITSGSVTATVPIVMFEMYLIGGGFNFDTGPLPSRVWGGAVFGNITISGNVVFHGTEFATVFGPATVTVADNSTAVFDGNLMATNIVSQGSGTVVTIKGHVQMTDSVDGEPNVDMSAGGVLNLFESELTNTGTGPNINCDDSATNASPNQIMDSHMNNGLDCGAAATMLSPGAMVPSIFTSSDVTPTSPILLGSIGAPITAAATISPTGQLTTISGTAIISTITPPSGFTAVAGGCLDFLASGAWSTTTGGNIATAMTAVPGVPYRACWFGSQFVLK